ncbi:Glutamine cyclotransferase, partial [Candidatus Methanophagaceae archaeon]
MTNNLGMVAVAIMALTLVAGCVEKEAPQPNGTLNLTDATPVYGYNIVNTYVHDQNAFTQGLVFADGVLYEGTGIYGNSTLRKVELETGKVLKLYSLPDQFFGEGVTLWGDTLIQL